MEKKKILIAVPTMGDVDMSCVLSLAHMQGYTQMNSPHVLSMSLISGSLLPELRNHFVQAALENNYDYLLFIDADMKFPPDLLVKLLAHKKDIITTNYVTKSETHSKFTAIGLDGKMVITDAKSTGLEEIALGATGTMLIDMKIFKKLKRPYFFLYWEEIKQRMFGEDYYFCHMARKKGFKVWLDHDLSKAVYHIGRKEYNIGQALHCLKANGSYSIEGYGIHAKNSSKGSSRKASSHKHNN